MNNILVIVILLLLIFIFYKNITLLQEGKKVPRGICSRKKYDNMIKACNKQKKSKKQKCKNRISKKCRPYLAHDLDIYRSCTDCCGDDSGCKDHRCDGVCKNFISGKGTKKGRPDKRRKRSKRR